MRNQTKDGHYTTSKSKRLIFANQNTGEKEFWLKKLAGKPMINAFPFDMQKAVGTGPVSDSRIIGLEQSIFSRLIGRADGSDYKLHIILMAAVMLLLNKYTGNNDVMIVTPIYKPKTDGEFINTLLPISLTIKGSFTFHHLLKETAAALKEAAVHRNYPVDLIPEKLNLAPVGGYSFFDVALLLKNIHHEHHLQPITPRISFSFQRCTNVINGCLQYDTALYEESFIREVIKSFIDLLDWVLQRPGEPISRMSLTGEVRQHLNMSGQVPPAAAREEEPVYCPPRDKIEKKLAEIWKQILEIDHDDVSIDDIFFEQDGQSLKAIMMSTKIHKAFNISIPLPLIFQSPTIRGLADYIKKGIMEGEGNITRYASIRPVEKKEYYSLSPAQKRLYVLKQINPDTTAYNMTLVLQLEENPDKTHLEEIFHRLIKRHEGFRTSFKVVGDQPVQEVHPHAGFSLEYFEGGTEQENETIIRNFLRPFDLSLSPLLRVGLIDVKKSRWLLMVDMHHIISDATSQKILYGEFDSLYKGKELPPLRLHYKDYSLWWELPEQRQDVKNQESYWLRQFKGKVPLLDLPTDFDRPAARSFEGNAVIFSIEEHRCADLRKLAWLSGSTPFIVLMAVFNVFLSRLSGQQDIVVGTPVVGRSHSDLQGIIGMFVNTLALRNYPEGSKKFIDFLMELKEGALNAFENQDYPFEDLVQHVDTPKDIRWNPLFTAMLSLHNLEAPGTADIPGLKFISLDYETHRTKFDLLLRVFDTREELVCSFQYCTKLFKEETIRRFIDYFNQIISTVMDNHEIQIKDITIPDEFLEVDTQVNRDEFSDFAF